jgi:hypothetical protein
MNPLSTLGHFLLLKIQAAAGQPEAEEECGEIKILSVFLTKKQKTGAGTPAGYSPSNNLLCP